jgi:hypothetical protein
MLHRGDIDIIEDDGYVYIFESINLNWLIIPEQSIIICSGMIFESVYYHFERKTPSFRWGI